MFFLNVNSFDLISILSCNSYYDRQDAMANINIDMAHLKAHGGRLNQNSAGATLNAPMDHVVVETVLNMKNNAKQQRSKTESDFLQ